MSDSAALAGAPAARVTVDLGALAANYAALQVIAAPATVAAVVKADAYGLGLGPVAGRLAAVGCRDFFVAGPEEGARLRRLLPDARILVLQDAGSAVAVCREARLTPVLNALAEVREWVQRCGGLPAALQIDTGMARSGLSAEDVATLAADTELLGALRLELVMTHLACADEPAHPLNALQLERFAALRARLPPLPTSIGNSAATLAGAAFRGDLVRPGLALYGGRALPGAPNPMRPVVRIEARILQIRTLPAGATVGYGATWRAPGPCRIATVGAGYADGYPRALGNRGYAAVEGLRLPVVGRVSMDMTTLDLSAAPAGALAVGDYVDLLGGGVPLDEAAELAGIVTYELLTGLAPRLARRWR